MSKLKEFMCYTHNDIIDGEPIKIETYGTHYQGCLNCSYQHLINTLGEPGNTIFQIVNVMLLGNRVCYGEVATIYNWKNVNYLEKMDN